MTALRDRVIDWTSKFNKIFYSNIYLIVLLAISFTCWVTDHTIVSMYIFAVLGFVSLIVNRDITPSLYFIPLMLISNARADFMDTPANFNAIIVAAVLFTIGLIFNIIFYRQKFKTGRLSLPLCLVTIALFAGGIASKYLADYTKHLVFIVSLGPLMLALYTIAMSCMHMPKDVDAKSYFARVLMLFGVIIALEVMVARIRLGDDVLSTLRDPLFVGWSNRNGLGTVLLISIGMTFYYADRAKYGNIIIYNIGYALAFALLATCSRGAVLFGFFEMVAILLYTFIKGKHRVQALIATLMWLVAACITIGVLYKYFLMVIDEFKELGLNSSGRDDLIKEAWGLFKAYPIFGVGFGYVGNSYSYEPLGIYWFHSTPMQILASMGIFGAICYGIYYIARVKMWTSHINAFTIMGLMSILAFEGQSLLDVGTFSSIPYLYLAVLLEIFVESAGNIDDRSKRDEVVGNATQDVDNLIADFSKANIG